MTFFENAGFQGFSDIGAAVEFAATQAEAHYVFADPDTDEFVAVPADFAADLIEAGAMPVC